MPTVSASQLLTALKKGDTAPVYLLVGDDEVGKEPVLTALCNVVAAELQPFNVERVYANEGRLDEAVGAIVSSARTLPLLGDRRVVVALRCEVFLKPKRKAASASTGDEGDDDESAGGAGGIEVATEPEPTSGAVTALERYLENPVRETCLVLVAADMARNIRLVKQLLKTAVLVEFWGLKSGRDLATRDIGTVVRAAEQMVRERVRHAGLEIRPDAIEPILEHAGADIATLRNDLDRLLLYCAGRKEVTADDVAAIVGGAVQINEWALPEAILAGNTRDALRQLQLALDAGQSPFQLLGQIRYYITVRLPERGGAARVPAGVEAIFRTDLALKSSGGDAQILLERLVVELCEPGGKRQAPARVARR